MGEAPPVIARPSPSQVASRAIFLARYTAGGIRTRNLPLACNFLYHCTTHSLMSILYFLSPNNLCLYSIFFVLILYKTKCELFGWGPKQIQIKKLSVTKFHNFLRSATFILVVFPSVVVYKIWNSLCRVPDLEHTVNSGHLLCARFKAHVKFW